MFLREQCVSIQIQKAKRRKNERTHEPLSKELAQTEGQRLNYRHEYPL